MTARKRVLLLIGSVVILAALGYWFAVYRPQREQKQLREAAEMVQLAVERYAVDRVGVYPRDLEQLRDAGYLEELPDSPYGGKVKLLRLDEPAEPGGVHYIPLGPVIYVPPLVEEEDVSTSSHQEFEHYAIVMYGRAAPRESFVLPHWFAVENFSDPTGTGISWDGLLANIESGHVAVLLDSGVDYQSGDMR